MKNDKNNLIKLIKKRERRKAKEAALEAAEEREIYLACERMGTTYKNKAERIEEAKNNGTYDSPEPSPRECPNRGESRAPLSSARAAPEA